MKTMLILPFIFLLMMITTLTSCDSCTSRGEDHYDTTLVDTMKAIVLDSAKDTIWCPPHLTLYSYHCSQYHLKK